MELKPARTLNRRSAPLKVMLSPETLERLKATAFALGVAPSTVASLAIGEYVARQHAALGATGRAVDAMVERLTPAIEAQLRLTDDPVPPAPTKPARKAKR